MVYILVVEELFVDVKKYLVLIHVWTKTIDVFFIEHVDLFNHFFAKLWLLLLVLFYMLTFEFK